MSYRSTDVAVLLVTKLSSSLAERHEAEEDIVAGESEEDIYAMNGTDKRDNRMSDSILESRQTYSLINSMEKSKNKILAQRQTFINRSQEASHNVSSKGYKGLLDDQSHSSEQDY